MNYWLKLALPVGLGLIAAMMNAATLTSKVKPLAFVRVSQDIRSGEPFTASTLEKIELSGDLARLPETALPWEHRAVLYNRPAARDLTTGDIVLWRDGTPLSRELPTSDNERFIGVSLANMSIIPEFIRVGQAVDFVLSGLDASSPDTAHANSSSPLQTLGTMDSVGTVGPFRVVAVGKRVTPGGEVTAATTSHERILTVAVKITTEGQLEENARRFLAASSGVGETRLLGIVLRSEGVEMQRPAAKATQTPQSPEGRA